MHFITLCYIHDLQPSLKKPIKPKLITEYPDEAKYFVSTLASSEKAGNKFQPGTSRALAGCHVVPTSVFTE